MRETYIKLISFLILFIGINEILHYAYKFNIYNNTDNARKERQFVEYNGELKYLFLGDSHSQNAIDPSIIGNSFNFASANENYIQTYFKLKGTIDQLGKKPETVVLAIDPSCFSSFRTGRFINPSELLTFHDYLEISRYTKDLSYLRTWVQYAFFMYAGNYTLINRFFKVKQNKSYSNMKLGFKGRRGSLSDYIDIPKTCLKKSELYLKGYNSFDPVLVEYFEKILDYCKEKDIDVYLMKLPMAKEYIKACNTFFSVDDYYKKINKIAENYSSVKQIFDYQGYFFEEEQYLRNPDHVNTEGARLFSKMLAKEFGKIENHDNTF